MARLEWNSARVGRPDHPGGVARRRANEVSEPERRIAIVNGVSDTLEGEEFDGSLARVALSTGETTYGTLTVGTDRTGAFDGDERRWLETVGRQIGAAIGAIRRRTHMLSDRVVELELACRDAGSFSSTRRADWVSVRTRFTRSGLRVDTALLPPTRGRPRRGVRSRGRKRKRRGVPADRRRRRAFPRGVRSRRSIAGADANWVRCDGHGCCLRRRVATITAECGVDADIRTIVDGLRAVYPDSSLIGKRETERAVRTAREYREGSQIDLRTDRRPHSGQRTSAATTIGPARARPRRWRMRWGSRRRRCTATCGRANTNCCERSLTIPQRPRPTSRDGPLRN